MGNDPTTQSLRLKYNAALSAHAACSRTLTEATMRGEIPSPTLVDAEARARVAMEDARAKLFAAMTIAGGAEFGPPKT